MRWSAKIQADALATLECRFIVETRIHNRHSILKMRGVTRSGLCRIRPAPRSFMLSPGGVFPREFSAVRSHMPGGRPSGGVAGRQTPSWHVRESITPLIIQGLADLVLVTQFCGGPTMQDFEDFGFRLAILFPWMHGSPSCLSAAVYSVSVIFPHSASSAEEKRRVEDTAGRITPP